MESQRETGGVGVFKRGHNSRLPMQGGAGMSLAGEVAARSNSGSGVER